MIIANTQVLNEKLPLDEQVRLMQEQIDKLYLLGQSRIRFGSGTDDFAGENISGEFQEFTSDATPDTEFSVSTTTNGTFQQGEGTIPIGRIILWQDKAGSLYQGPTTGTAWTNTTVQFKCDVASVKFNVFLVK